MDLRGKVTDRWLVSLCISFLNLFICLFLEADVFQVITMLVILFRYALPSCWAPAAKALTELQALKLSWFHCRQFSYKLGHEGCSLLSDTCSNGKLMLKEVSLCRGNKDFNAVTE